jgi:hypothetical protein
VAAEDLPRQVHDQEDITEEHSFDELAHGLASGSASRRQALKLLGGALLGGGACFVLEPLDVMQCAKSRAPCFQPRRRLATLP